MHYRFRTRDIRPAVQRAVDEYHGLYFEKKLQVEVSVPERPIVARIDEERCVQVVGNLIANAIGFSHEGDSVRIEAKQLSALPKGMPKGHRARIRKSSAGFCVISVHDQGPGVPDEDKEKIFQRFFVTEKRRKEPGQGTGLGLAISRRIAAAHSGAIWVEDNPGGGSVFSLLLPLRKSS
jgi:signal transduction histidine kinase